MAKQNFRNANSIMRVFLSCVFSFFATSSFAFEVSPYTSGSSRESDLQMQQAQEAIRSICSCVVGPGQGMNTNPMASANCAPITAASLQQNPYGNPMGMPGMGINGQMQMNGQPGVMMPGMLHNGVPGMQQPGLPMQQPAPMMNQPGMIPGR